MAADSAPQTPPTKKKCHEVKDHPQITGDLPANALDFAATAPGRAFNASKQMLGAGVRATRREIRTARQRSGELARDIYARANAPFQNVVPWQRGGLND